MTIEFKPSPHHSSRNENPIDMIVIHATANKSFDGALSWMQNPNSKVSAHYLVGKEGEIAQLVEETQQAWHAGESSWDGKTGLNKYSIGIEVVNLNDNKDEYSAKQISALVGLIIGIRERNPGILLRNVVGHNQIAPKRKTDPGIMFPWFEVAYRVATGIY